MDYQKEYLRLNPTIHAKDAEEKFKELVTQIPKNIRINRVLDVGCGTGVLTTMLTDYIRPQKITAVDISRAAIRKAQKMHQKHKNLIKWKVDDILTFQPKEKFDLIICADIIEHIKNDAGLLKSLGNIGKFIIVRTPLEDSLFNKILKSLTLWDEFKRTERQYGHLHHYSVESFRQTVRKSGLKIKSSKEFLIERKRTHWFNELARQIARIIGLFSKRWTINFGGGFIVACLSKK